MEMEHIETASPFSALGAKGVGAGNSMSAPAAIANAVSDALRPVGVSIAELPITPSRLFEAVREREEVDE